MTLPPPPLPGGEPARPPAPPPPTPSPPTPAQRDGKLITAGVMSIIAGLIAGGIGTLALVLAIAADGLDEDSLLGTGDAWSFLFGVVAFFLFVAAALALVAGVGCVMGRRWGRIMAIIVWTTSAGLMTLSMVNEPSADVAVPLAWSVVIVLLAALGTARD